MAGSKRHDLRRRLLFHAMNSPKEVVEFSRGRNPEKAFHSLIRLVEYSMRDLHRKTDKVAGRGDEFPAVKDKVEPPIEHVDELVLAWMDMRGNESAWRKRRMPGE